MPSVFSRKKEKSKNRDGDTPLSDISKTDSSSISLSTTEVNYASKLTQEQMAQMRVDKKNELEEERRNDAIETALSGTAVVLGLVNEAAQFSQVPGLQNAASLALGIVTIIQGVKQNNRLYTLLAKDATDFIASIWRAYQQSSHKDGWLSPSMKDVITELVVTLVEIKEFVKEKTKRGKIIKILSSNADPSQVQEYRQRINTAVKKFELASHLKMNETLLQLHRDQLQIAEHLNRIGINTLSPEAMFLHAMGKSQSGFEIDTSANTSLVALASSVVSSQSTSAATSPRVNDQPSGFIEERPQSPRIVVTDADTPPPSEGSASNSPQPSSPPKVSSPPAFQPISPSSTSLSSPSSLPTSPSSTAASISSPLSADSATFVSPTLVGSPEAEYTTPAFAAIANRPLAGPNSDRSHNTANNHSTDSQYDDQQDHEHHDINILVDNTHAPSLDPGPDEVRKGKRMASTAGNTVLKGVITASPSGTASESESRGGRSATPSDTDTAVSEGADLMTAADRAIEKQRQFENSMDIDDDDDSVQYEQRPSPPRRGGRGSARTDTEVTLTSERKETLKSERKETIKSPVPRRGSRQSTVLEDEEPQYDSPASEQPRRRSRQDAAEPLQTKKRSKPAQEAYEAPSRPARGPTGRPGPQRGDTARSGSRRTTQEYDDDLYQDEEPRRPSGKGKAPQNHRATVHDISDDDDDEEAEQEEYSEGGSHDYGNTHLKEYVADVRKKAAAAVSGRTVAAAPAGSSARKGPSKNTVGKEEELNIKFSQIDINSKRKQQRREVVEEEEEEEEEEDEEEEPIPPPKKRPPKKPRQQDAYDQYGRHNSYAPPDPYYGGYHAPYPGYHQPPPPQQYGYHLPPPPPRYGPNAMPFNIPGLGYGMGGGTSSTVTMSNVGNDNSVRITTNKIKKSKRRDD